MRFEKIVCDRCKKEMNYPEDRRIWLSGIGREGGYDLCTKCYYDLYHWFNFEPSKCELNKRFGVNQQPCEDAISRQAVKEMLTEEWTKYMPMESDVNLSFVLEKISELPSVTPKAESEE